MDEFSTGIQEPGGNAGEKSGERSEIEIFDFVNQKPDLTTLDKGLFAENDVRSFPKREQAPEEPGPRYENAWEEIELRDTERRAEEKRRVESEKKRRTGTRGTEAGRKRTPVKRTAEAGQNRTPVKRTAEAGRNRTPVKRTAEAGQNRAPVKRTAEAGQRRVSGKRRVQRADRMRRERAVRIRIALIAAIVLICVLAGILFARRKRDDKAIPVTVRREPVSSVSVPEAKSGLICRDALLSGHVLFFEDAYLWE